MFANDKRTQHNDVVYVVEEPQGLLLSEPISLLHGIFRFPTQLGDLEFATTNTSPFAGPCIRKSSAVESVESIYTSYCYFVLQSSELKRL